MVKRGCRVVGVDTSPAMLAQLKQKEQSELSASERRRLSYLCMDMRRCSFRTRFALILCPYSAFNYFLEESDQRAVFEMVHAHLAPDGLFILDTFIPQFDVMMSPDDRIFHDYERTRADGTRLVRDKTIRKDHDRQINEVCRTYRLVAPDGTLLREISTRERIRYFFRSELELLLRYHGFTVVEQFGDFTGAYSYKASTMAFVCRPC